MTRTAASMATYLMVALPLLVAQAPHVSLVLAGTTQKISEHVYVIPDADTTPGVPNVGIVVGSKGVLVVDTGMGERNGRIVLAETEKVAKGKALYLVTTHVHPEHDLGAGAFPASTKMIRSKDEEKDISEFGLQMSEMFQSRSALNAELLKGAAFRKADISFDKEYDLDLGGVHVRILAMGANHTLGDTAIFVEPDRVLFSGDIAMKGQPAFTSPYSTVAHWLASLDVLAALQPKIIVPSHGPMGDGSFLTGYRTYLTAIRDRAAEMKRQGKSQDDTVKAITAQMQPVYPDAGRLSGAILQAYKEAR
jgi:glyoxylase-like metal-dependent hydrolase (beta-lactamase superfamily II)